MQQTRCLFNLTCFLQTFPQHLPTPAIYTGRQPPLGIPCHFLFNSDLLSDPSGTDLHLVFSFSFSFFSFSFSFSFSSHLALFLLFSTSTCPRPPNPYIFRKLMIIAIQKLTNCVHQKCWIPNATANVDSVNVCRTHRVPTFPWLFPSPCITSVISLHNLRNSSSDS